MSTAQIDLPGIPAPEPKQDAFMVLVDRVSQYGPDVLGKALDAFERFQKMQAKTAFEEAMATLKRNMPAIIKSKLADMNGKYQYHYAELAADVCAKLDPVLEAHGFRYSWTTRPNDKGVTVVCVLTHLQGHSEETMTPPAPHDNSGGKNPIQAIASTLSYLQRYSLLMGLGIAPKNVDTDGKPPAAEIQGLDDWCSKITDASNFEEMDHAYKKAFALAHEAKSQSSKTALIAAREAWRKKRGAK